MRAGSRFRSSASWICRFGTKLESEYAQTLTERDHRKIVLVRGITGGGGGWRDADSPPSDLIRKRGAWDPERVASCRLVSAVRCRRRPRGTGAERRRMLLAAILVVKVHGEGELVDAQ